MRFRLLMGLLISGLAFSAIAQDVSLKTTLQERLQISVQEVRKTSIPGLFEIRINDSDILYSDAKGDYVVQGSLFESKTKRNLTKERVDVLTAVKWGDLPFKDALKFTRGDGSRQLAVFADPNCGYCKHFERELLKVDNITVHVFQIGILSPDSKIKNQAIWCSADRTKAWLDYMTASKPIADSGTACDTAALERNEAFARKVKVTGTPTLFFKDGSRESGAIPIGDLEKHLLKK